MSFFSSAVTALKTIVIALGGGLCLWGGINLLEGYGNDNPGAKSQGMKQIICHDIAIHNFQESSGSELFEPANIVNYWFSEILFEFENPEEKGFKPSQKLDAYRNSSKQLIQRLRQTEKKWCDEGKKTIQLHFNEDPLIYNKVFENEVNKDLLTNEVKTFYKYAKGE